MAQWSLAVATAASRILTASWRRCLLRSLGTRWARWWALSQALERGSRWSALRLNHSWVFALSPFRRACLASSMASYMVLKGGLDLRVAELGAVDWCSGQWSNSGPVGRAMAEAAAAFF
eukprot:4889557-Ditylum_brightwellii.AAC.1